MTNDELLIREAIHEEAGQAVDPGTVLSTLHSGRKPRRSRGLAVAVAGVAVAAGIAGVMIPLTASRGDDAGPAAANTADGAQTEQTILVLGLDNYLDEAQRPDAIVLLRVRADGAVRALSVPRDTRTGPDTKLNLAYPQAGGGDRGAQAMVAEVEKITGVRAQHYATVDMAGFPGLSTAVGGVEVCLKNAVKDTYSKADLKAGKQTVSGEQALAFLRQRHGMAGGDLDRIARHQAFLQGLVTKLGTVEPARLASLVDTVKRTVHTDPALDVLGLARRLTGQSGLTAATIPVADHSQTSRAGTVLTVDNAKVKQFTTEFFGTGAAPASGAPTGTDTRTPCVS
ncbi:LCP family protein [Kibdelosporangium phytohabitans]|uniref:Cell envelope-related transcriptional attenuator domain-containing protein n=1 Tax=Kibdelosporangium phytohabitans TaxID=860235 RepID=A0A0N9I1B7_9PSEU|nr:LCP family protein [Kibdelosporangium phytohabitans]ALG11358.1 hypothetical protein AOZ06_34820 [Kibdelosporangium phytohabitans]MBE1462678.1 LCP family protein required for cell wall assembly [Kibdelosporangium phytohabitans]